MTRLQPIRHALSRELAARKTLGIESAKQPFEYPSVRYWSKEINGTLPGGRKRIFLIRADVGAMVHGGRAG